MAINFSLAMRHGARAANIPVLRIGRAWILDTDTQNTDIPTRKAIALPNCAEAKASHRLSVNYGVPRRCLSGRFIMHLVLVHVDESRSNYVLFG
jgi:hypothetical protein